MVSAGKRPLSQVEHLLPGTGRGFQGLGSWASISLRSALWGLSYFGQRSEQGWFFQKVFSIAFDKVLQDKKPLVRKEFEEVNFLSASSLKEIKTFKSTFKLPLEPLKTLHFKHRTLHMLCLIILLTVTVHDFMVLDPVPLIQGFSTSALLTLDDYWPQFFDVGTVLCIVVCLAESVTFIH